MSINFIVSNLVGINSSCKYYRSSHGEDWTYCRPRMNHKMVVSWEQYQLIPQDIFEVTKYLHSCVGGNDNIIVEFTGLRDGWKFSYE